MHRKPDGVAAGFGPGDAVPPVRRNEQMISGNKRARRGLALEQHASRTGKHRHPFVPVLVVPEAVRALMATRDDALNADIG